MDMDFANIANGSENFASADYSSLKNMAFPLINSRGLI